MEYFGVDERFECGEIAGLWFMMPMDFEVICGELSGYCYGLLT